MSEFLTQLNEKQREAASTVYGPVMIIAGAGSGKTRVLTYRTAHLLADKHAWPSQILLLTFTNKAAKEMKERISTLIGEQASRGLWMGTFHSIFAKILRMEGDKIGYDRNFSIYDTEDQERLIKSIMNELQINQQQFSSNLIKGKISSAKNRMWLPADMETAAVHIADIKAAEVYKKYQQSMKDSNAMDFDDLLMKPIELFDRNPDVLAKYQKLFKFVMIDEYQDTNKAQYLIAKKLADINRNICVVGDDAQSIYSWRGADIQNILDFEKDYKEAKTVRLEQNYRSTKRILSIADSVIKANKDQLQKTLWTENPDGDFVTLIEAESEREESQKISGYIQHLKISKGYQNSDFAILYRTNAQSRALEDGLRRIAVPYMIIGGIQFYKRKEVKDVLAYLKILVNPKDAESFKRIVNYPGRGVGEGALQKIEEYSRTIGKSLVETLSVIDMVPALQSKPRTALFELKKIVEQTKRNLPNSPLGLLVRTYIEELGIMTDLQSENTQEGRGRVENVQELINAIEEFSATREEASLETFLQEVSLVADIDSVDNNRNVVTLMTLHAAKGLEFPAVFLAGLEEGLFPLSGAMNEPSQLEEERRLCYVGVTRAEKKLYLSHAKTRMRYGSTEYTVRSRFVDEMNMEHIRTEGGSSAEIREKRQVIPSDETSNEYQSKSAHYWRDDKYQHQKKPALSSAASKTASKERQIVYDEGAVAIREGIYVYHQKFGRGRVMNVSGSGDDRKATVFFMGVGNKTLVLKFANLQVVK